ncbi:MAG: TraM recognition domain-containing protein [Zavarzinella sp.]
MPAPWSGADCLILAPGKTAVRLDLVAYELNRPGGSVESLVQLLVALAKVVNRNGGDNAQNEAFWQSSMETLLRQALTALHYGSQQPPITMDLYQLLTSLPESAEFVRTEAFLTTKLARLLGFAGHQQFPPHIKQQLGLAFDYLTGTFARLSDRTRSVIEAMVRNTLEPLVSTEAAEVFASGVVNETPDSMMANRKVVILDWPVLVGNEPARAWNALWILLFQRAGLRRPIGPDSPPLVVFRDEYPQIATPSEDAKATLTGRSQKVLSVILFQSLPAAISALGGTDVARQEFLTVLGNHGVKFIGNTTCPETGQFFSQMFGSDRRMLMNGSIRPEELHPADLLFGTPTNQQFGFSEQILPLVRPEQFATLRRGEFFIHRAGPAFRNGRPFKRIQFAKE